MARKETRHIMNLRACLCALLVLSEVVRQWSIKTLLWMAPTCYTMILEKVVQKTNQRLRNKSIDPFETWCSVHRETCRALSASKRTFPIGPDAVLFSHEVSLGLSLPITIFVRLSSVQRQRRQERDGKRSSFLAFLPCASSKLDRFDRLSAGVNQLFKLRVLHNFAGKADLDKD